MKQLKEKFRNYLQNQLASAATIKNYLVDVNHFLSWLAQKAGQEIDQRNLSLVFTNQNLEDYKTILLNNNIPLSTINRRLSALRKFGQFGVEKKWLTENPGLMTNNLNPGQSTPSNDPKILVRFKKYLEKEKISPITIKNYLSDLRHFLNWLEVS